MAHSLNPKYSLAHDWVHNLLESWKFVQSTDEVPELHFNTSDQRLIVEIGIYEGASTVWFSDTLLEHPDSTLISIDPFTGSDEMTSDPASYPTLSKIEQIARANVAKSKHPGKVQIEKDYSWRAYPRLRAQLTQGIDILYIDGAHDTTSVMQDIALYAPHVKSGGAILFDDYGAESVRTAVDAAVQSILPVKTGILCPWQLWIIKK